MSDFNAPRKRKGFFPSPFYTNFMLYTIFVGWKRYGFLLQQLKLPVGLTSFVTSILCVHYLKCMFTSHASLLCFYTIPYCCLFYGTSQALWRCTSVLSLLKVRRESENVITPWDSASHTILLFLYWNVQTSLYQFFQYDSFRHEKCARFYFTSTPNPFLLYEQTCMAFANFEWGSNYSNLIRFEDPYYCSVPVRG